ncbi:MAG: hypothetical protein O3B64_01600 [bacterium]|nr:hypothetical protein [bacterium]MDA1024651.1 hypothetical protein [bacterium]
MKIYLTGGPYDNGSDLVMYPIGEKPEPFNYKTDDLLLVSFDSVHPHLASLSMVKGGRMYMIDVGKGESRESKFVMGGDGSFVEHETMMRLAKDLAGQWVEVKVHATGWRQWQLVHN